MENNWFGESWSRPPGPKTMKLKGFRVFPKWNRNVTNPEWSRIILRSFWATLLVEFTIKMPPQDPFRPQIRSFPRFSWIFYKKSVRCWPWLLLAVRPWLVLAASGIRHWLLNILKRKNIISIRPLVASYSKYVDLKGSRSPFVPTV